MATLGDLIRQSGAELCLQLYAGKYAQKFKDLSCENSARIERAMERREKVFVIIGDIDTHVVSLTQSRFPEALIRRVKSYAKSSTTVLYYGGWRDKEFAEITKRNMSEYFPDIPKHNSEQYPSKIRVRKERSLYDELVEDIVTKHKVRKGVGLTYEERIHTTIVRY